MFKYHLIVLRMAVLMLCLACSACSSPAVSSVIELVISPTPTNTPTPTITPTPAPTSTPEPTPTPQPRQISIEEALGSCQELAAEGNQVVVEGNIYLPEFSVVGYETSKGMILTGTLPTDPTALIALITLGDIENTMNPLPEFFSMRDLVIRAANGQVIRYGHSVSLKGRMEFKPDSQNLRCALRVEEITSLMPAEVNTPVVVEIGPLLVEQSSGHGMQTRITTPCGILAGEKQLVTVKGAVIEPAAGSHCTMGLCEAAIADATGQILLSIVQGDGASSMMAQTGAASPADWQFYDTNGKQADSQDIALTGVLYSDGRGCRIVVYEVEQH